DPSNSPVRSRRLGAPPRQPSVSLRIWEYFGKDDRPKQSSSGLLSGRIHKLPTTTHHRNLQRRHGHARSECSNLHTRSDRHAHVPTQVYLALPRATSPRTTQL